MLTNILSNINLTLMCHNPSLGFATKAKACKGVAQKGSLGVWEGVIMNIHTPK